MTTPNSGVNNYDDDDFLDEDAAAHALLANWEDAEKPSNKDAGETTKKPKATEPEVEDDDDDLALLEDEDEDEDTTDTEEDEDSPEDQTEKPEATDDHVVKVTVDGETKSVTVKDLKRLFGQEASLTRKSQEVANTKKAAEADAERYMVATQRLITKAEERAAPYASIDWMVAQQRLTPDEFAALRSEAAAATNDLNFLTKEADSILESISNERRTANAVAAKEAVATLEKDIPGWNQDLYNKVCQNAVDRGMDPQVVSSLIDPSALKLLHDAMRYSDLKARASLKKQSAPKSSPKRVVKPSRSSNPKMGNENKGAEAAARLRKTGSRDDAVAALMARWENSDD